MVNNLLVFAFGVLFAGAGLWGLISPITLARLNTKVVRFVSFGLIKAEVGEAQIKVSSIFSLILGVFFLSAAIFG